MKRRTFLAGAAIASQIQAQSWPSVYRVDPAHPHHLVNREGRHLFILNKTAWFYFLSKDPLGVINRAKAQGVNVLRVALEGRPYHDVMKLDLWPWGGTREAPQWDSLNEPYWDEVERRVALAHEHGMGINLVLYMSIHPERDAIARHQPYWRRALDRLAKYPNILTWEVANEYLRNESFQDAAGEFLAANDPQRRPVCTSDGTTDDAAWPDKPWVGLAIVHTCTGSGDPWTLRDWYLPVARNTRSHGKPAFNNETGREKRHRNDDPVHRRKQSWVWCCAGAYWTWHSWEGCEGIDDADYRASGSEFLMPLRNYFESVPFWRMNPNETVCTVPQDARLIASVLSSPDRSHIAAYLCSELTGAQFKGGTASLRLPAGEYNVSFLRPASLERLGVVQHRSQGLRRLEPVTLPDFEDDLLIDIRLQRRGAPTTIPGTG